jgi:hypothetical protein
MTSRTTRRSALAAAMASAAASAAVLGTAAPAAAHPVTINLPTGLCSVSSSHTVILISSRSGDDLGTYCSYRRPDGTSGSAGVMNGSSSFTLTRPISHMNACTISATGGLVGCTGWRKI